MELSCQDMEEEVPCCEHRNHQGSLLKAWMPSGADTKMRLRCNLLTSQVLLEVDSREAHISLAFLGLHEETHPEPLHQQVTSASTGQAS